jgi:hypothetical protein
MSIFLDIALTQENGSFSSWLFSDYYYGRKSMPQDHRATPFRSSSNDADLSAGVASCIMTVGTRRTMPSRSVFFENRPLAALLEYINVAQ